MLRFLSNYLFQNENQPNENDPTTTNSDEQQQGPTSNCKQPPPNGDDLNCDDFNGAAADDGKEEFMDLEMRDEGEEDDDDWVLVGEKKRAQEEGKLEKSEVVVKEDLRVQVQPEVALVAAPSSTEEEDDDDDEELEEEEQGQGLMWENKLIEHPSMSVYVDLATSINSNGVTASCASLSSIAPTNSPGDSVIVLEQPDSDDEEEDDEDDDTESMDFVESIVHESPVTLPQIQTAEQVHLAEEEDPSDTENLHVPAVKTASIPRSVVPTPPVQNGRRKKGHYPCSSSNSAQMPRRAHLRNSGGSNTTTTAATSLPFNNGASTDAALDAVKRIKRSGAQATAAVSGPVTTSAIGITLVNGAVPTPPTSNGMTSKNLKLVEMFPTASNSAKRRHRRNQPPQKAGATPKGHFLQEAKRRQDLQNHTKHSCVNNDRRSATQRRVQKNAGGAAAATHNGGGRAGK